MFNSLYGIVSEKQQDGICLDCNAIEWFIMMPAKEMEKLTLNEPARIYVYLQHQETLMQLFGFTGKNERRLFLDLLKVNGIGPKQAIKILSNIEMPALIKILESGDVNALRKIPGIGKITAQKIMLALQGKLSSEKDFIENTDAAHYVDIIQALVELGYEKRLAQSCVEALVAEAKTSGKEIDEGALFRAAIARLCQTAF